MPIVPSTSRRHTLLVALVAMLALAAGCSPGGRIDRSADVIELPNAAQEIDFDDVVFSPELDRIVLPARDRGVYFVDPDTGDARRLDYSGSADSADSNGEVVFVLDRADQQIHVLEADTGRVLSSAATSGPPDYIRSVESTHELWISEPGADPAGIEIFALGAKLGDRPRHVDFIAVPEGPEGLTLTANGDTAYTHAGPDVVQINTTAHKVTSRWPTGCDETHGFPRLDERDGLLLASCANDGRVTLLDVHDGHRLGAYEVGGGESLPAYSPAPDHFYVRSDPGTEIATLKASHDGLQLQGKVDVPEVGHCLGADDAGHYWTCDAESGQLLLFDDS